MRLPELEVLNALESIDPEVWTRGSRAWLIVRQHATIMFESLLEGGNALRHEGLDTMEISRA